MPRNQRVDWLAGHFEAVKSLGLREDSWVTFQQPNFIVEVRDLIAAMNTQPLFHLALEVSRTGNSEHLFSVTDHARIVSLATGLDTYPANAALRLTDHLRGFVGDRMYQDVPSVHRRPRPRGRLLVPTGSVRCGRLEVVR